MFGLREPGYRVLAAAGVVSYADQAVWAGAVSAHPDIDTPELRGYVQGMTNTDPATWLNLSARRNGKVHYPASDDPGNFACRSKGGHARPLPARRTPRPVDCPRCLAAHTEES